MHLDDLAVFRLFFKDIACLTDVYGCRGHDFLAYGVDRRICNLSKKLLKIIEKRLRLF